MKIASASWRRWAAGIGFLFACTGPPFGFTPGHVFTISGVNAYGAGTSPAVISSYAVSHRTLLGFDLLGECVLAVSLICFAALLGRLTPSKDGNPIGWIGFGASILSACMVFVTVAAGVVIVELASASDYQSITSAWLLIHGVGAITPLPVATLMATTGLAILLQRTLPLWAGWFSLAVGALMFLEGLNVLIQETVLAAGWPFQLGALPATSSIWAFAISLALLLERRATRIA